VVQNGAVQCSVVQCGAVWCSVGAHKRPMAHRKKPYSNIMHVHES